MINIKKFVVSTLITISLFHIIKTIQLRDIFEYGIYTKYAQSMLKDGDFNVINQNADILNDGIVTQTYNHPAFSHSALASYIIPFIAYENYFNPAKNKSSEVSKIENFESSIFSAFFFVVLSIIAFYKFLSVYEIKHIKKSILISFASTPALFYFLFITTIPDFYALSYSIFSFIYIYTVIQKDLKKRELLFLGLIAGFGLCIRVQLFWICLFYIFMLFEKIRQHKVLLLYFSFGLLIAYCPYLINQYLRSEELFHPYFVFLSNGGGTTIFIKTFWHNLFGPNGYLSTTPIYFLFLYLLKHKKRSDAPVFKYNNFLFVLSVILFVILCFNWFIFDSLTGRLQIEYVFILILMISLYLNDKGLNKGFLMIVAGCILWHARVDLAYYNIFSSGQNWNWRFFYHYFNKDFSTLKIIKDIIFRLLYHSDIESTLIYVPLIILLVFISIYFTKSNQNILRLCRGYFIILFLIFALSTALNCAYNKSNVKMMQQQGFYKDKVVTYSNIAYLYHDYVEVIKKASLFYLYSSDCKSVTLLDEYLSRYLDSVNKTNSESNYFPKTHKNMNIVSSIEEADFVKEYVKVRGLSKCAF